LYILDRVKDIIIVSGFNVCASEVEKIILEIKGISDKDSGEVVCAHVVLENNSKKNRDSMKTKINK